VTRETDSPSGGQRARAKAVIFDIGNVLIRWDPRFLYEKLIPDPAERDWFLREVVPLSWHTQHDRGRPFAETIPERQAQYPDYAALIAAFYERWDETIPGEIPESVSVLERLADAGIPLYALSNYSAETFPLFRRRFGFARHFRDMVISGEEGMVKPDPRLYDRAIARFGVDPMRTAFVDDRRDNVEAARAKGMHGLLFEDPRGLGRDLRALGLPA